MGNKYMVTFIDYKTNYCRVFLAKTKDAAAKQFEHFLAFFKQRFGCISTGVECSRRNAV